MAAAHARNVDNLSTISDLSIVLHGVVSLLDATSYDKVPCYPLKVEFLFLFAESAMLMLYCYMFAILVLASSPNSVDGYSFIDLMNAMLGTPTKSQLSTFTTSSTPTTTTGCVTSDGAYACGEFFKIEDKHKKICMFAHCSDLGLIVLWEAFPCYPYDISTSNTVGIVPPQSTSGISSSTHNEPQKPKNQSQIQTVDSSTTFKVFSDTTSYMRQEIDTTTQVLTSTSASSPTHNKPQVFASTSTESITDTTSNVIPKTDTTTPESTSTESVTDTTSYVIPKTDTTTPESTSTESATDTTSYVIPETDTTVPDSTSTESVMDTTSVVTHETDTTTPKSTSTTMVV